MKSRFTFILLIICSINCSFGQVSDTFKQGVDSLSAICLKVELFNKGNKISSATGFVIEKNANYYLITNLHVVTGIDFYSKAIIDLQLRTPDEVGIWHNTIRFGQWHFTKESLYDKDAKKRWIECSFAGKQLDLVALRLQNIPKDVKLFPFDPANYLNDLMVMPGFSVSIIGFPNGITTAGKFAIWKTGHLASDIVLDVGGSPQFMIDATTRPGMSGSIVFIRMSPYITTNGMTNVGIGSQFLGIYTSQSDLEELGYVLKPITLKVLTDSLP